MLLMLVTNAVDLIVASHGERLISGLGGSMAPKVGGDLHHCHASCGSA